MIFWGTGLGPVTFDETQPAVQADMTNVPLQVYIGGQPAKINFRGRNGCCSSADTVYVTVPLGVSGCNVSVLMQIGNVVSIQRCATHQAQLIRLPPRHVRGLTPNSARNVRLKFEMSPNPLSKAMSTTFAGSVFSRTAAWCSRRRKRY